MQDLTPSLSPCLPIPSSPHLHFNRQANFFRDAPRISIFKSDPESHESPNKRFVILPSISILTSDHGVDDKDNGKGGDNGGSNHNNHRNSMDMDICSNWSTGMGHNIAQDKVAPLTVNNTISPRENDRIGGYQLLYLD